MTRIHDWRAERSGAAMRVNGKGEGGEPVKLTRIVAIDAGTVDGRPAVIARRDDNALFHLVLAS